MTTAATRVVVLLGHPVGHSRSPQIHSAAFAETGIDAVYVTADVRGRADLSGAVAGIRALGLLGANVTVPYKQDIVSQVDDLSAQADLAGAVNTLFWRDDVLVGDNTDVSGLVRVLRDDIGTTPGVSVEIFGAGGVARAAAVACGHLHLGVRVVARRPDAAAAVEAVAMRAGAVGLTDRVGEADVVINATPLGMHGEALPERYLRLEPQQVAVDLVYAEQTTPFVRAAQERGVRAVDGLSLLVAQAADSFTLWTGRAAPVAAMRQAVGQAKTV